MIPDPRTVLSAAALVAICVLSAAAAPLYQSDFAQLPDGTGEVPQWHLSGGQYVVRGGWLTVASEKSNPFARIEVRHDGDGTFRATVRNSRGCHWAAILAKGVYRLETNRQFVALRLMRQRGDDWEVVAEAPDPWLYAHNTQQLELRLTFDGATVSGFVDQKRLVQYTDPEPAPMGGAYGLLSGWGTNLAWGGIEVSDAPDAGQWPFETLAPRADTALVGVTRVRGEATHNVYYDGETASFDLGLATHLDRAVQANLRFRLVDVRQREVAVTTAVVELAPGQESEITAEFRCPGRGCFKVAMDAGTSARELAWVEDIGSFTVLPRQLADAPARPESVFGGHMDGISHKWHLEAGRKIGIQWARCHDMLQNGWWTRIQPGGPDEWQWPYDPVQWDLDAMGFSTLGELLWTPQWASSAPPDAASRQAYPPADWDAYRRYVAETVEHYGGSIKHWEIWNEPHFSGFWRGTPQQYAELLKVAYTEVKRVAPDSFVLGGGGVSLRSMDWIAQMLEAGAGPYMDGFSIHYLEPDCAGEQTDTLRRLLDEHGVKGPIWNTEECVPSTSFLDQVRSDYLEPEARYHFRNACYELVRTYMENLANGVRRVFYYEQADPWRTQQFPKPRVRQRSPLGGGMWDEGQMLKPIAAAHAALSLAIEGKTFMTRVTRGNLQVFIFEGPQSATAVQYALFSSYARRESMRLQLIGGLTHADFTAMDFMGNEAAPATDGNGILLPLSREPVYLTYRGRRAGDVLRQMYGGAAESGEETDGAQDRTQNR